MKTYENTQAKCEIGGLQTVTSNIFELITFT